MTLHLGWPQITYLAMTLSALLATAKDHGKPRKPENFWTSFVAVLISYTILIWGGFFK